MYRRKGWEEGNGASGSSWAGAGAPSDVVDGAGRLNDVLVLLSPLLEGATRAAAAIESRRHDGEGAYKRDEERCDLSIEWFCNLIRCVAQENLLFAARWCWVGCEKIVRKRVTARA